jgi:hypothetical protein
MLHIQTIVCLVCIAFICQIQCQYDDDIVTEVETADGTTVPLKQSDFIWLQRSIQVIYTRMLLMVIHMR